jgi:hypothetical protein
MLVVLAVVQPVLPLQMLVQLEQLHYRHELPQPVLLDQASLAQHRRGCC